MILVALLAVLPQLASPAPGDVQVTTVNRVARFDTSPALRDLAALPPEQVRVHDEEGAAIGVFAAAPFGRTDFLAELTMPSISLAPPLLKFEGVGAGMNTRMMSTPPDANGDVGRLHYVQMVNAEIAIFSKSGTLLYGPTSTLTIFRGFGGSCSNQDHGDPLVVYDALADRWVITYVSYTQAGNFECVAVSADGDPMGAWHRYAFSYPSLNDYGKLAVWPGSYVFTTSLTTGGMVCALDRAHMLDGQAADQQCFATNWVQPLPADLDGARPPPLGAPAYVLYPPLTDSALSVSRLYVDWAQPSSSRLTARQNIPVAGFSFSCGGCVPQPNTPMQLETMTGTLMNRLAYRNLGDHESLVVNHAVDVNGVTGVRWYELRIDGSGNLNVFQQGTWAPDANHRWLASAAMDGLGNLALGYSVSSDSVYPSIRYSGRLASDPPGLLTLGEGVIYEGDKAQTWGSRWGDYSALQVDPVDDCTFWYTTEYAGTYVPGTRIAAFRLPGCGTFALLVAPDALKLTSGQPISVSVATQSTTGSPEKIELRLVGVPAWMKASIQPGSLAAGQSATVEVTGDASAPPGASVVIGVEGTSPSFHTNTAIVVRTKEAEVVADVVAVRREGGAGCSTAGLSPSLLLSVAAVALGAYRRRRRK